MQDEFQKFLDKFEKKDSQALQKLKKTYNEEKKKLDKNDYEDLLESELQIEKKHLVLVDSIISMFFTAKEHLDYRFVAVDPLTKVNGTKIKSFDILFVKYYDKKCKILLVEVKSSISNIGSAINDFEDAKKVYRQYKEFFEKQLVGETIEDEEFVLALLFSDKDDLLKYLAGSGRVVKEMIIWSVDPFKPVIKEIKQSEDHKLERQDRRVHQDTSLDPLFSELPYINLSPLTIMPTSHIVRLLEFFYIEIYNKLKQRQLFTSQEEYRFHKELVKCIIDESISTKNLSQNQKNDLVKLILDIGIKYQIFKQLNANEYKLRKIGSPYKIINPIGKKYVDFKMDRDARLTAVQRFNSEQKEKQEELNKYK